MKWNRFAAMGLCLVMSAGFAVAQQTNEQTRQDMVQQANHDKKMDKRQTKADKEQAKADKKVAKAADTHEAKDAAKAQDKADHQQDRADH